MNAWITKLKQCSKEYQNEKKRPKSNYKPLPKKLSAPTAGLDKLTKFIHDKERKQYVRQNINLSRRLKKV